MVLTLGIWVLLSTERIALLLPSSSEVEQVSLIAWLGLLRSKTEGVKTCRVGLRLFCRLLVFLTEVAENIETRVISRLLEGLD